MASGASIKNSRVSFIVCVAFLFRLAIVYFLWHRVAGTVDPKVPYGFETGNVAESIALGRGFSSPLGSVQTGPTAWLCPLYPYLVAGIFKVWGIFTRQSHVVIQLINCLFSALTIFPIYAAARRTFGTGVAVLASWAWVFLPDAWHVPVADVWDTALTALLLSLIFWATLAMRRQRRLVLWAGYGALWALGALVNAAVLSLFPFFLGWLAWELRRDLAPPIHFVGAALLMLVLGIAPWTARNYYTFGRWIPLRSNLGLELWLANGPGARDFNSFTWAPSADPSEMADFQRLGEMDYMTLKQRQALAYMRSHPRQTLGFIAGRIGTNWFSVTDRPHNQWATDPLYLKIYFVLNAILIWFSWGGAVSAFRANNPEVLPYVFALLVYPLVYYLAGTLVRYRFPLEPILIILAAYGIARAVSRKYATVCEALR
jgi:4-amino-4-deoxy-L-arabinose transferase-like glycosyltransferase